MLDIEVFGPCRLSALTNQKMAIKRSLRAVLPGSCRGCCGRPSGSASGIALDHDQPGRGRRARMARATRSVYSLKRLSPGGEERGLGGGSGLRHTEMDVAV